MSELRAALVTADITPPVGVTMSGYGARDQPSDRIETPLTVSGLVVAGEGGCAAIACCDLIGPTPALAAGVRQQVAAATGLAADDIMVCASHTHWGPAVRDESYYPPHLRACILPEYLAQLTQTIAGTLVTAWRDLAPCCAGWGIGLADGISFNRRPVGADGKVAMNLVFPPAAAMIAAREGLALRREWRRRGFGGPRLSPPQEGLQGLRAGVTDPEVPLLKLVTPEGTPLAGLINFGCHPVVGGEDNFYAISPDYPGEARRAFAGVVGGPLAFCLGCAGDQVPAWRGGSSRVRVGRSLGAAAARAWYQVQDCSPDVPVRTARRSVVLGVKPLPSVAEAQQALAACADPAGTGAGFERRQLDMAQRYADGRGIETEIWAVRIGDWAAVGMPGETMAEIGLRIKQQSPFGATAVITLAGDAIGYISTAHAHREGGYEPTWSAPGPEAEQQVVDTALELLHSL